MKIIILGGFLGSGKTSILMSLAAKLAGVREDGRPKVVVIENEIGEIGVDDKLLRTSGYEIENMFSGCACCSLSGEMTQSVKDIIRNIDPEMILIESSGVGYPHEIKSNLEKTLGLDSTIVSVVDAKRWMRMLRAMEQMMRDQLVDTEYLLVNKTDLVDTEILETVDASVRGFVPHAKIHHVSAIAGLDPKLVDEILAIPS